MSGRSETTTAADEGRLDRRVGRLEPERDQEGPRGTYGCACKSRDAAECHRVRYGIVAGDVSHGAEECYCLCHQWDDEDDDDQWLAGDDMMGASG